MNAMWCMTRSLGQVLKHLNYFRGRITLANKTIYNDCVVG